MEDGVDVTRRNLIEFTDTEQAHEDENEHSQKSWVILLMNIHKPNRVIYDVSK